MFAVFDFDESLIIVSAVSNELDLNDDHDKNNEEKDESFLFLKKLLLDVERAQESQRSNLRLNEDKNANTDNSCSVHFKNDDWIFEQDEKRCFLSTSSTSVTDSEAEYNS